MQLLPPAAQQLYAVECKLDAGALTLDEAQRHLELADQLQARAVFGALQCRWRPEVIKIAEDAYLLGPEPLLGD